MAVKVDRELEMYRKLMVPPSTFEEGFSLTSLSAAMFVALIMVPGAMYMGLMAGMGIGPAAQWVTVLLFIEVAKRAHKTLGKAEIFVLFYICGALMATPFSGLLWNQFLVRSEAATAAGIADQLPSWFAPKNPEVLAQRSLFMWEWLPVLGMVVFHQVVGRLNGVILCYGLFRVASDIERLPFPMAPVGAQGIMAVAEDAEQSKDESQRWRWRAFSIGGAIGVAFAVVYMALPMLSQAFFDERVEIFPIPWVDWTSRTQEFLPAVAVGLSFDLGNLIVGMVLPFFAMVGSFTGMVVCFIANPLLRKAGILTSWQSGDGLLLTQFKNTVDFYYSFGIGIAISIALIGIYAALRGYFRAKKEAGEGAQDEKSGDIRFLKRRGHIPLPFVIACYLATTMAYIIVSGYLIDWHRGVMTVLLIYGFLYTPIISYVTARLEGMVGQVVDIPMVREAGFILSGYQGVAVWFIPLPLHNFGMGTVFYRQAELTGTRFWSIWKSDLFLFPIILFSSIMFANFIWSLAPIPSAAYPNAQRTWELGARTACITYSATLGEFSQFEKAISAPYIGIGAALGIAVFSGLSFIGAPIMMMYGVVRGLNQTPIDSVLPQFLGALLGKFYFERRMGVRWRQYVPVLCAGYFCGAGLTSVFCIGLVFLSKAVFQSPF